MADFAVSADPEVQRQLDRLWALSPGADILGLERITQLLARIGEPHRALPPVFHVAGTNGKGSTCAFLRAALEASGLKTHVYTSPHLVRFNERIRVAGELIDDARLAALLTRVLDAGGDIGASFFEVATAVAFLAFAETPADACVIEVGLGGRLDATNVIEAPIACGIAQLGIDHQAFLGNTIEAIAGEKAGIAKPDVPLLTLHYPARVAERIGQAARAAGARWLPLDGGWRASARGGRLHYEDARGAIDLPLPRLAGAHQTSNAALAVAMLRHQDRLAVPPPALRAALGWADWPARLQRLTDGPIRALLPAETALWLDGGHNPAAAHAIAQFIRAQAAGRRFALVLGMLANKDLDGFLAPFAGADAIVFGVPVPGHAHHAPGAIAQAATTSGLTGRAAIGPDEALRMLAATDRAPSLVLIGGSLYLAGAVLAANGTPPM